MNWPRQNPEYDHYLDKLFAVIEDGEGVNNAIPGTFSKLGFLQAKALRKHIEKRLAGAVNIDELYKEYRDSLIYIDEYLIKRNQRKFKKLTDDDVKLCRKLWPILGTEVLALRFQVNRSTISNAVKGITFRHLNSTNRPWF